MLNIQASFICEPFFTNNTKRTFENWIESSEKGVIQVIVVGKLFICIVVFFINFMSYHIELKQMITLLSL